MLNNKQTTAVQWLIKKLTNRQNGVFDGLPHLSIDEIYAEALAIERKQIEDAYLGGQECVVTLVAKRFDVMDNVLNDIKLIKEGTEHNENASDYFTSTFKEE